MEFDQKSGQSERQFVYQLDDPNYQRNGMSALDNERFLVIEQDGLAGNEASFNGSELR